MDNYTLLLIIFCIFIFAVYALTIVFVFSKADTKVEYMNDEVSITLDKKEKDN